MRFCQYLCLSFLGKNDRRTACIVIIPQLVGAVGFINDLVTFQRVVGCYAANLLARADSVGVVGIGHACAFAGRQTRKLPAVLPGEGCAVVVD